jgi:hypothetical protein
MGRDIDYRHRYLAELRLAGEKRRANVLASIKTEEDTHLQPPSKKRRGRPLGCKNLKTRAREAAAAAGVDRLATEALSEKAGTPSEADS